ncbi:MAG TPA: asparagine synthase (glutamine-hydrolyzing) [Candidatus Angelobacter sp.]|nr:asparagine synthase (glutamine-hydrolyzing) [Candidatus Angelobacter sp.]
MCGICGYFDVSGKAERVDEGVLGRMAERLVHRGPDSSGQFLAQNIGLGFRRLSLIDLEGGDQPLYNEDRSLVLICNGEIYNYRELRNELVSDGHRFSTRSDVEVLLHLYEEYGVELLHRINGQFAFALYDIQQRSLLLARDHFGINPLYYANIDGHFVFSSEIKGILEFPGMRRDVDLTGLDQVLTFPGLISPRTMFKGVSSLPAGNYLLLKDGQHRLQEYWDLDYPTLDESHDTRPERYYADKLKEALARSVKSRLHADVPVGFYLSGGLDSSMIAALIGEVSSDSERHSFSITFTDRELCESKYQKLMSRHVGSIHHETQFDWRHISHRLKQAVYHSESPLKETYNTASLALSEHARSQDILAILTGEGADELFAGYVGYRFDQLRRQSRKPYDVHEALESEMRLKLWDDSDLFYEKDYLSYADTKKALYSAHAAHQFDEFDCLQFELVNKDKLRYRHYIHQRSYLDFKLRMADHLLSDHGDRMALANSIEARYPFLDLDVVKVATEIPPDMQMKGLVEKYILRMAAEDLVPKAILEREKYAFLAPGSAYLLGQNIEWINDLLSSDRIKREGYFNPAAIERLKARYTRKGFTLNLPFESDLLIIVITFGIFLEMFEMPTLN